MSDNHTMVRAIKAFNDNYIWAISADNNKKLALVDPGDAQVCINYIEENNLTLFAILITHHHSDHVGGIDALLAYAKENSWQVTIYGPKNDNIAQVEIALKEDDIVTLTDLACQFRVIDLPGHTKGHIAYHNEDMVFCGDTLFSGGCGRLFEGTAVQMHQSLTKLANLTDNTLVYCAHEYTLANLAFALAVEPNNCELQKYIKKVEQLRHNNQATIPSNLALERQINPFLRCHTKGVKLGAEKYAKREQTNDSEVFSVIRAWKDNF